VDAPEAKIDLIDSVAPHPEVVDLVVRQERRELLGKAIRERHPVGSRHEGIPETQDDMALEVRRVSRLLREDPQRVLSRLARRPAQQRIHGSHTRRLAPLHPELVELPVVVV